MSCPSNRSTVKSIVYAKSIYIFLAWDDPKFKLKYIIKWTKLQDDKIRIMSENS
jgi:hypothetical protein